MARRLKVDSGTLAKWETGKKEPKGGFLIRLQRLHASDI
jgi:DNA-binding transcriptional regulator YiaG